MRIACKDIFLTYFQAENSDMTVVAFLIFPAKTSNYNVEALRGQAHVKQLRYVQYKPSV